MKKRCAQNVGLKGLVIRSCGVPALECKEEFEGLAEKIVWEDVMEMVSDYESETEEETDWENEYYDFAYWSP